MCLSVGVIIVKQTFFKCLPNGMINKGPDKDCWVSFSSHNLETISGPLIEYYIHKYVLVNLKGHVPGGSAVRMFSVTLI